MARVKLKDVVMRVKDKVDKDNTELEFYVGGEHIDGNEICVTKRGIIQGSTIGPAFHMAFKAGDVLLMSRNPHLRKASMVDFDGICSDVSYVCRTKDESVLLQSYLPFLLQSDDFWRFAEENKKGGLPFFLNWSDFERYEFELPSIEKQRELSDLLWAMQRTKQAYQELLAKTDELVKSQFIEMFKGGQYPIVRAQDVCHFITKGTTPKADEIFTAPFADSIPYLKVYNLSFDGSMLFFDEPQYIARNVHEGKLARSKVYPNDLLMNIVGPPLGKFALVNNDFAEWNINQALAIFRAKETIHPKFLLHALMQPDVLGPFLEKAQGVRQLNFSLEQCRNLEFPLPSMEEQLAFVAIVEQTDKSKFELKQNIENINSLMRSLMRQDFSN